MASAGGKNDYILLDTGQWACRWLWIESEPHYDLIEQITLVGCTHVTELEAARHVQDATRQREVLLREDRIRRESSST